MAVETLVTDAPISHPVHPFWDQLVRALDRLKDEGLKMELDEHGPILGFHLLSYIDRSTSTRLDVWEDYRAKVKYIEIRSDDLHRATIRAVLTEEIRTLSREHLLAKVRKARSNPTDLMRLVLASSDGPDDETVRLVADALTHKRASMREAAAYGCRLLGWSEFRAPLERALAAERDSTASRLMNEALEGLGRPHRPQRPT